MPEHVVENAYCCERWLHCDGTHPHLSAELVQLHNFISTGAISTWVILSEEVFSRTSLAEISKLR
jgi:hypothetical protein